MHHIVKMLSTCLGRNLCNSKLTAKEYEAQPVKDTEYNNEDMPPDLQASESVNSEDMAMIDAIRQMASEEQELTDELNDLSQKEATYKRAMDFCTTMFRDGTTTVEENPELTKLKSINKELTNRNNLLEDSLADAKLELKQLKEVINGPLKRELERARRDCLECQCRYKDAMITNEPDITGGEISFLKEQLQNTYNNIADIHAVNAEIRQEVLVLNYKCQKLQELLIKNKVEEINTLKNIS